MELKIVNLSKTYPNGLKALNHLSLTVPSGMFGLVGPNGAGKSTLMRTIATLQDADEGAISLDGLDVLKEKDAVRRLLGYLPQEFGVYPRMSAQDLLDHLAVMKGVIGRADRKEMVNAILHQTNLHGVRKKRLGTFSGGMKQRFGIAQALLGNPRLIIVDEPTAGLDPTERNRFLNLLSAISEDRIVLLSTHIVADVHELCTRMAMINKGEVLVEGHPQAAIDEMRGSVWRKRIAKSDLEQYRSNFKVVSTRMVAGMPEIRVFSKTQPEASFTPVEADLEDVYFLKLGGAAEEGNGLPRS